MILHFASTGQEFRYTNYLAILTAKKVHSIDEVKVWATEIPSGNLYFDKVKELASIEGTELIPPLPAIERYSPHWQKAIKADYLRWALLERYGGMYLDLDTVSIKDMMPLLGDKEVCVGMEKPNNLDWMGAHCVLAKPKSEVITYTFNFMMEQLNRYRGRVRWGATAPMALAKAYKKFGDTKMKILDYEITSPFSTTQMAAVFDENVVIPEKARVIHTWNTAYSHVLKDIDHNWIAKSNTPYAIAVKRVLKESEWRC